jgi:hypothetical protein
VFEVIDGVVNEVLVPTAFALVLSELFVNQRIPMLASGVADNVTVPDPHRDEEEAVGVFGITKLVAVTAWRVVVPQAFCA